MDRELCLIHANCQGEPLKERLIACPAFADRYRVRLITNYTREPVPDDLIGRCSLFLYQFLGPKWNELSSESLLARLPETARPVCIPNMFFKGYWPTWSGEPGFDYRCRFLDHFIAMGLPAEETVVLCLRTDPARLFDLDQLLAESLEHERNKQARTPIAYLDLFEEAYGQERLFHTVNHPGGRLMNLGAVRLLRHLGIDVADDAFDALAEPFSEFDLPINPMVAGRFGWKFAGADTEYAAYGRTLSYAGFVARYVAARKAGIEDFIGVLAGG